ncbi:MAG: PQQ-binding-like beta-propeller repeat protein [Planctomycetaceae bacterium]|nr:PQQ-binding-like beta-propeller repeat protein [Planctomycetaceae bacterium]
MRPAVFLTLVVLATNLYAAPPADVWPAFRGDGTSVSPTDNLPVQWAARGHKNVAWIVRLAGYGQSCPVISNGAVFVTAVDGEHKEKLLVQCLDLHTGERRWMREFAATQKIRDGDTVSRGAPTPAVDDHALYAMFESGDLIALAHDGRELWRRSLVADYGEFTGPHGYASSLAQHADRLLVQVSHRGPSYLLALNKATGQNLWKTDLPAQTAWSSPLVADVDSGPLVLAGTGGSLHAFSLSDGAPRWQIGNLKGNTTPSPVCDGKFIVVASSEPGFTQALRLDASQMQPPQPAWLAAKTSCGYSSPLIYRGQVYIVGKTGIAACHDLESGELRWTERLPGPCWATPLAAGDRVYFVTKDSTTAVVQAGPKYQLLAENELSFTDVVYGAAAVDGSLLLRSGRSLARVTTLSLPAAAASGP